MRSKTANDLSKAVWDAMAADLPKPKVYDQAALTQAELMERSGLAKTSLKAVIAANVKAGKWEQVWKRFARGSYPAYRKARK